MGPWGEWVIPPVEVGKNRRLESEQWWFRKWRLRIEHTQNKLVTALVLDFFRRPIKHSPMNHKGPPRYQYCTLFFRNKVIFRLQGFIKKASELTPGSNHGRSPIQIINSARTNIKQFSFVMPKELSPKKKTLTFHYPGCLIGILIMVFDNPLTG